MTGLNLKFSATARQPDSLMSRVETALLHADQLTLQDLSARLDEPINALRFTVRNLVKANRAHQVRQAGAVPTFAWGPEPRESVATMREFHTKTDYVPPQWTNEIARPGSEDHKQYGSLQPDGTVKPYRPPSHGCVGRLNSSANPGRG